MTTTVPHPDPCEVIRAPIESEHNRLRDNIEKQYVIDRRDLETQYQEDLKANRITKKNALVAAGLNPDGSTPPGFQTSSPAHNTAIPTITGTAQVGQPLTADKGTWTGTDSTFTYQWERSDPDFSNALPIAGANTDIYTVTSDDLGKVLRVFVTAANADGEDTAVSAYTATVIA